MTDGWYAPGEAPRPEPGPQPSPHPSAQPSPQPPQQQPQQQPAQGWGAPPPGAPDLTKPGPRAPLPPPGQQPGQQPHAAQYGYGYGYGPGMPPPAPLAPRPGVVPLRPLSLGEIYDGAFQAMRRNPGPMIGSAAVIGAFTAVATALWQLLSGPALLPLLDPATAGTISDDEALGALGAFGGGGLVAILVSLVAVAVLSGILVLPVSRAVTGQRAGFGEVWRAVWPRFWALLGVVLVVLAAVTGIVLLLVVPGVLAAVDLAFLLLYLAALPAAFLLGCWTQVVTTLALPAVMLERAGPVTALRRGWTLVGGMWTGAFWRSLGILLLAAIIVGVAQQLIALPAGLLSGALAFTDPGDPLTAAGFSPVQVLLTAIAGIVAAAVVYPFQAGVGTLLYVDHRMRREGLDVELARAASQ